MSGEGRGRKDRGAAATAGAARGSAALGALGLSGAGRLVEETRERFLREIVARVALDRIAAVHLFRPMRQGGVESGVAVVAAVLSDVAATVAGPGGESGAGPASEPATRGAPPENNMARDADADGTISLPRVPFRRAESGRERGGGVAPRRHTVFTARYRLTIKGPDRGRWEVEVVEEADAPLGTVDAVVRGVQRRAGDEADAERFDAAALALALGPASAPEAARDR